MIYKYNDNELLYLYDEDKEEILRILFQKYTPLIKKRLKDFKIQRINYDDFYQECLMCLVTAAEKYRRNSIKTFNKYFDLIMQRQIINILKKNNRYFYNVILVDSVDYVLNEPYYQYEEETLKCINSLTKIEKEIYDRYFCNKQKIKEIALELNYAERKVYNTIARIRNKSKK